VPPSCPPRPLFRVPRARNLAGVNFYVEQVRPHLLEVAMRHSALAEIRSRVCAGLTGDVLEIGYGTGLNHEHLPPEVQGVWAVEPSAKALQMAAPRRAAARTPVVDAGTDAQRLDLPDDRFDGGLSTFTLCGIPDAAAALGEVARVLRPGAVFSFVEHGLAPDASVRRWQRRLNPVNKGVNGCLLDRDVPALVTAAGFRVVELQAYYHPRFPRFLGHLYVGRAQAPAQTR
jgi:SAM-dependent methyltransferase